MTALTTQTPLNTLRSLTDQTTDQDLVGNIDPATGQPVNPLIAAITGGTANPPPPVNPAVAQQHALAMAALQNQQANQPGSFGSIPPSSVGELLNSITRVASAPLGSAAITPPGPPSSPGGPTPAQLQLALAAASQQGAGGGSPVAASILSQTGQQPSPQSLGAMPQGIGMNGPTPAQPQLAADAVNPQLAALTASGSPNSPIARAIAQRSFQDEMLADQASNLKQQVSGRDPITGQISIDEPYSPDKPGPYGFNPDVMAGAIPSGNVDVNALVQKANAEDSNTLHPDMARRFGPGAALAQYIDDRGPLLKSMTDGTNIALPSYKVKGVDQMTPDEFAALPPEAKRAIMARDARARDLQALADKELEKVGGDNQSAKHWHGDVAMTDAQWGAAREKGTEAESRAAATHLRHAAMRRDREERQNKLMEAFTNNVANLPPGFQQLAPQVQEELLRSQAIAREGSLNRQKDVDVADKHWTGEKTMKEGENMANLAAAKLADPKTPASEQPFWKQIQVAGQAKMSGVSPGALTPPPAPQAPPWYMAMLNAIAGTGGKGGPASTLAVDGSMGHL